MVHVGTSEDVPAVSAVFASAFHEDPVWGHWAFPDETTRDAGLRELMGLWTASHVRTPTVWVTEGLESVAAWVPPGHPDLSPAEEQALEPLLTRLFGDRAHEFDAMFEQFDAHRPDIPHWYLSLWGTRSDAAGQGHGSEVIAHALNVVDAAGMPAYLESSNPVNIPRYEALGFKPQAEFSVPGSPVLTTMFRPPR